MKTLYRTRAALDTPVIDLRRPDPCKPRDLHVISPINLQTGTLPAQLSDSVQLVLLDLFLKKQKTRGVLPAVASRSDLFQRRYLVCGKIYGTPRAALCAQCRRTRLKSRGFRDITSRPHGLFTLHVTSTAFCSPFTHNPVSPPPPNLPLFRSLKKWMSLNKLSLSWLTEKTQSGLCRFCLVNSIS